MTKDVTQVARQQRYLYLLEKVQAGKTLSSAELSELTRYEAAERPRPAQLPDPPEPRRKSRKKPKGRRRLISTLRTRRLGYAYANIAEADQAEALRRPLAQILAGDAELMAAWQRGQYLRTLERAAATAQSLSQAARWIKIQGGGAELRRMLDDDPEARDIWDQSWLAAILAMKDATFANAKAGNPAAIKAVESWLREELLPAGTGRADFNRVTMMQLCEIMGVTRQAIDKWFRQKGLPRNQDGTFDLRTTFAWFEKWVEARASSGARPAAIDPMRSLKTKRIEVELDHELGRLLDRDLVIQSFVQRFEHISRGLANQVRDLPALIENQTPKRIAEILDQSRRELLSYCKRIPAELRLPDGAAESLTECLEQLI